MRLRFSDSYCHNWEGMRARSVTLWRFAPYFMALAAVSVTIWMWQSRARDERTALHEKIRAELYSSQSNVALRMRNRVRSVTQLAGRWDGQKEVLGNSWLSYADRMVDVDRGRPRLLAWVDPELRPRWKKAPGDATYADQELAAGLSAAAPMLADVQEKRIPVVSPAFDLTRERKGMLIASPLRRDSAFDGLIVAIFGFEGLLSEDLPSRGYFAAIRADGKEIYKTPNAIPPDPLWVAEANVDVGDVDWVLQIWPSPTLLRTEQSRMPEVVLGGGLLLALLLSIVVHLAQTTRHTSEKREETKALFQSVFENALDPMVVRDSDMRCVDANSAACFLFGLTRAQLRGTSVLDFVAPEEKATSWESMQDFLVQGRKRGFYRIIRSDGTPREVEFAATANIVPGRHLTIYRDITERLHHEAKLAESEERYRDLFENATDLIQIVAPNGQVLYANRAWTEALGYEPSEIDSLTIFTIVRTESIPSFTEAFRKALTGEKLEKTELEFVTKSGKTITVDGSLSCMMNNGKPVSVRAIFRDITQSKFLESQLRHKNEELEEQFRTVQEASRLKSEFLANMSHELRTPLNAVLGFAELMLDERVGAITDEQRSCLDDILSSATHLLQLINDVLDLSKVEAGKMEFHPERVNVPKLIAEVRDVVRSLALQKNIRIDTFIEPEVNDVVIDPSRLKQLFYNYVSNALKFTPDGGRIAIRAAPHGSAAFKITVEDTGIGIAPEDIEKLFSEFRQLDASTSKKYQGTGLGLALTKRMVEAQGGKVTVKSTVGQGSVFGAILPRTNGIPLSYLFENSTEPIGNPDAPSVLVIEDDSEDRSWLVRTITEAGYVVETATTGAQALSRICSRKFDAVTLDLLLPDMSGWEIMRKIRASGPNQNTPVIIATLVSEADTAAGFVVHDFLTKPIDAGQLLASIEKAAAEPNAHRQCLLVER